MIIYYKFYDSYDKSIVWAFDFSLPNVSDGIGNTVESLKDEEKFAWGCVLLFKVYEVVISKKQVKLIIVMNFKSY